MVCILNVVKIATAHQSLKFLLREPVSYVNAETKVGRSLVLYSEIGHGDLEMSLSLAKLNIYEINRVGNT